MPASPNCGYDNPESYSFCHSCGSALRDDLPSSSKAVSGTGPQLATRQSIGRGCISSVVGFLLSAVVGLILGYVTSLMYALVGQTGGIECLALPLAGSVFVGSTLLSFGSNQLIRKLIQK